MWLEKSTRDGGGFGPRWPDCPNPLPSEPRILLLEDDHVLARRLARGLTHSLLTTDVVMTLEDSRAAIDRQHYDCLVLDRVVPDGDAFDLIRELRPRCDRPPVLILSALGDAEARVEGLSVGADEYLVKPTQMVELVFRIELLLARHAVAGSGVLEKGAVVFDPAHRLITLDGEVVYLTPRQYGVFNYLMNNPHRLVGAEELFEHCWDGDQQILRQALRSQIAGLRKIFRGFLVFEMVQGYGYIIRLDPNGVRDGEGGAGGRGDGGR